MGSARSAGVRARSSAMFSFISVICGLFLFLRARFLSGGAPRRAQALAARAPRQGLLELGDAHVHGQRLVLLRQEVLQRVHRHARELLLRGVSA